MSKFSKKPYRLTRVILSLFVLGISPASHAATNAATDNQNNRPLDVVLVMDSSGSMKQTDPRELRKPAAKLLISLLGEKDRASVVSFSDQGYPVAFLTPVKGKTNEANLFSAVDKISNKGVYTNLQGAVQAAMRVINRNPLPDRKAIIVLMTDGKMDLGDSAKNQSMSETLNKDLIPQLKSQNIELHTIAFTDQSDKAYLEQLAQATGGKFNLAQTDKQLHDVYTSIFEQNKQPNMLPFDGENFTIDNAIKEVTIVGSKDSQDVVLSLLTPGGEVLSAANIPNTIKWFTAEAFDLITIQNPQAGQWQIKSSTGKNKAYVITDLKFQLEVQPQEVAIGEGLMINAWLEDKGKTIDKPSILATLSMALRVHTPDGETHELSMQAQTKEDASGELSGIYLNHIALPADGRYKVEVVAQGSTFSRVRNSMVTVFDPNSVPHTDTAAIADSHAEATGDHDVSPAMPSVEPAIEPPVAEPAQDHAKPEQPMPQPTAEDHAAPVEEPQNEEHSTKDPSAEHAPAENPDKPAPAEEQAHKDSPAKDEPNLGKALGIFLLINGVFALLGGLGFLVYRMKQKKAAKANADDDDGAEEKPDDKKRAA